MTTVQHRRAGVESLLPPAGRRRRRIALIAAIVAVFAVFAVWLVAYSPVFGVRSVQVHGLRTLPSTTVERIAGIDYGQPVVRVDTAAIAERVETLPQVASAQVATSFPSTVVITVTERVPVGYVMSAGRTMLVDRTGKPYLGVRTAVGVPRLVLSGGRPGAATAVAAVATTLPAALRARTVSIEAFDPDAVTLVLRGRSDDADDQILVRWGSAQRSRAKAIAVTALQGRKKVDRIDVTNPDRPFTS